MRTGTYRTVMRHGDHATLDQLIKLYREAETMDQKVPILGALGVSANPEVLERALEFALTDEVPSHHQLCPRHFQRREEK
jgi:puromycin-sensitive aminopeptidase